jgi:hypothetical protein
MVRVQLKSRNNSKPLLRAGGFYRILGWQTICSLVIQTLTTVWMNALKLLKANLFRNSYVCSANKPLIGMSIHKFSVFEQMNEMLMRLA